MYGLVNKAIQDLIVKEHGVDTWRSIAAAAGCPDAEFLGMQVYDDRLTYDLVGAASAQLGVDGNSLLEAFGRFWVRYTADEGYGGLMDLFGDNLLDFLGNLDAMHARISLTMEDLRPPSFEFVKGPDDLHRLLYRSPRAGLAPMVVGLLNGLAERFGTEVEVELQPRDEGADTDEFLIRIHRESRTMA